MQWGKSQQCILSPGDLTSQSAVQFVNSCLLKWSIISCFLSFFFFFPKAADSHELITSSQLHFSIQALGHFPASSKVLRRKCDFTQRHEQSLKELSEENDNVETVIVWISLQGSDQIQTAVFYLKKYNKIKQEVGRAQMQHKGETLFRCNRFINKEQKNTNSLGHKV